MSLMEEFARAKARMDQVPPWARPVITTAHVVTRQEQLDAEKEDR